MPLIWVRVENMAVLKATATQPFLLWMRPGRGQILIRPLYQLRLEALLLKLHLKVHAGTNWII